MDNNDDNQLSENIKDFLETSSQDDPENRPARIRMSPSPHDRERNESEDEAKDDRSGNQTDIEMNETEDQSQQTGSNSNSNLNLINNNNDKTSDTPNTKDTPNSTPEHSQALIINNASNEPNDTETKDDNDIDMADTNAVHNNSNVVNSHNTSNENVSDENNSDHTQDRNFILESAKRWQAIAKALPNYEYTDYVLAQDSYDDVINQIRQLGLLLPVNKYLLSMYMRRISQHQYQCRKNVMLKYKYHYITDRLYNAFRPVYFTPAKEEDKIEATMNDYVQYCNYLDSSEAKYARDTKHKLAAKVKDFNDEHNTLLTKEDMIKYQNHLHKVYDAIVNQSSTNYDLIKEQARAWRKRKNDDHSDEPPNKKAKIANSGETQQSKNTQKRNSQNDENTSKTQGSKNSGTDQTHAKAQQTTTQAPTAQTGTGPPDDDGNGDDSDNSSDHNGNDNKNNDNANDIDTDSSEDESNIDYSTKSPQWFQKRIKKKEKQRLKLLKKIERLEKKKLKEDMDLFIEKEKVKLDMKNKNLVKNYFNGPTFNRNKPFQIADARAYIDNYFDLHKKDPSFNKDKETTIVRQVIKFYSKDHDFFNSYRSAGFENYTIDEFNKFWKREWNMEKMIEPIYRSLTKEKYRIKDDDTLQTIIPTFKRELAKYERALKYANDIQKRDFAFVNSSKGVSPHVETILAVLNKPVKVNIITLIIELTNDDKLPNTLDELQKYFLIAHKRTQMYKSLNKATETTWEDPTNTGQAIGKTGGSRNALSVDYNPNKNDYAGNDTAQRRQFHRDRRRGRKRGYRGRGRGRGRSYRGRGGYRGKYRGFQYNRNNDWHRGTNDYQPTQPSADLSQQSNEFFYKFTRLCNKPDCRHKRGHSGQHHKYLVENRPHLIQRNEARQRREWLKSQNNNQVNHNQYGRGRGRSRGRGRGYRGRGRSQGRSRGRGRGRGRGYRGRGDSSKGRGGKQNNSNVNYSTLSAENAAKAAAEANQRKEQLMEDASHG